MRGSRKKQLQVFQKQQERLPLILNNQSQNLLWKARVLQLSMMKRLAFKSADQPLKDNQTNSLHREGEVDAWEIGLRWCAVTEFPHRESSLRGSVCGMRYLANHIVKLHSHHLFHLGDNQFQGTQQTSRTIQRMREVKVQKPHKHHQLEIDR